jgi:hypothetical protein
MWGMAARVDEWISSRRKNIAFFGNSFPVETPAAGVLSLFSWPLNEADTLALIAELRELCATQGNAGCYETDYASLSGINHSR